MEEMKCQGCEVGIPKPGLPWCDDCLEWEDHGDGG